ncbi:MAG: LLM class flavin-dependent oxidoreductase [Reyranella sp.]|nr:LLM class flavin-dependent oxidoreductase [Reyranella sp.]
MKYGICIPTWSDCWKLVKRAENAGFSSAWFYDTQLLNAELFAAMGAAAVKTDRIRLGTGVLIPSNRIAPVAAAGLATLNALAPGRIDFGVGTGFTGRRTMGLAAITRASLKEYLRIVQGLLARETVEWDFEGLHRKIRFLNPEAGLVNTTDPIPLHISAMGPKMRSLTAELGAGWLNALTGGQAAALQEAAGMRESWRAAGRAQGGLSATAFLAGAVLAQGEAFDSARAKAQAGPWSAIVLHSLVEGGFDGAGQAPLPPFLASLLERYRQIYMGYDPADARYLTLHRGHLMFLRPEEEPLITADLIRETSFTATPEVLAERIRELGRAGYTQVAVQMVPGHEDAIDDWARVFERV